MILLDNSEDLPENIEGLKKKTTCGETHWFVGSGDKQQYFSVPGAGVVLSSQILPFRVTCLSSPFLRMGFFLLLKSFIGIGGPLS